MPLVSVNTPKLDVEVLRIGDRGLLPTLRSEEFLSQLSGSTAKGIADQKGQRVWKGTLDHGQSRHTNREAVTAFPVLQAVGKLEPGLYLMLAKPSGTTDAAADEEGGYETQATQWFVVSDLGLTAFKAATASMCWPARSPAPRRSRRRDPLGARNNDVLATAKTDGQATPAFPGGLARGEGGLAPGLVVAQIGDDYGFLDLAQGAFDLSDRGVKGRPAPGGAEAYVPSRSAASTAPARRCS